MKKILTFLLFFNGILFAQEKTARNIADEAIRKGSPENVINFVQAEIQKLSDLKEKRSLYIFLGTLQETFSKFSDASNSYAKAAGIKASNSEDMIKKTNEELVLDAVRCSLSWGDFNTANSYLNSSVRSSKNQEILAKIKLYEQWAILCKAETTDDLNEPIAMLDAYKDLDSMKSVKPSILLTLFHLTGKTEYSDLLQKEFPTSMETGIVQKKISILPSPFWYFTPNKNQNIQSITQTEIQSEILTTETNEQKSAQKETESKKSNDTVKLQLGLFREKSNAQKFVESVNKKGFNSYIIEEKRSNGSIYFAVLIDRNGDEELSLKLKTQGFENYQYSE